MTTPQTTGLLPNQEETVIVEPTEQGVRFDSAPAKHSFNSSKRMSADSIDATHSAQEHGVEGSGRDDGRRLSKKPRGSDFRCPYFAANPELCQDARCESWRNPSIAAVTRHALRDSNKNDASGEQSRAIKSLSHRKLSPEERWGFYYQIHGGADTHERNRPYWPHVAKSHGTSLPTLRQVPDAEFLSPPGRADYYATGLPRCSGSPLANPRHNIPRDESDTSDVASQRDGNSLTIRSFDDLLRALLELIAKKEARDDAIDTEVDEREARKIAAVRHEMAQEKLTEKSRNHIDFVAGLKDIIKHSQSANNMPSCAPPASHYEQVDKARSAKGTSLGDMHGSRRSASPSESLGEPSEVLEG